MGESAWGRMYGSGNVQGRVEVPVYARWRRWYAQLRLGPLGQSRECARARLRLNPSSLCFCFSAFQRPHPLLLFPRRRCVRPIGARTVFLRVAMAMRRRSAMLRLCARHGVDGSGIRCECTRLWRLDFRGRVGGRHGGGDGRTMKLKPDQPRSTGSCVDRFVSISSVHTHSRRPHAERWCSEVTDFAGIVRYLVVGTAQAR